MRQYLILILIAISMAFLTGYMALSLQGNYTATEEDILEINNIKLAFQKLVSPKTVLNFNSVYYGQEQFVLLNPLYALPDSRIDDRIRYYSSKDCFKGFDTLINRKNHEKIWIWEEFRCGKRSVLPRGFFLEAPYMHPSGHSYAYLSFLLAKDGHGQKSWVMGHLPYFHSRELKDLVRDVGELKGVFAILGNLDGATLDSIFKGKGTILNNDYLFARLKYPRIFNILEYRVYARNDLDKFLEDSPYNLYNFKQGKACFYRDGSLCWDYSTKHAFRLVNKSMIVLFGALIFFITIVVRMLMTRIKVQRMEDEKRRLALRVLTHEFRTPVASLLLIVERLNKHLDKYDEADQDEFLRLAREVYRLQRLTETSRNYLKAKQGGSLINFNEVEVANIEHFAEDTLDSLMEENPNAITIESCGIDGPWLLDVYWLGICLKNLVDNALTHGVPPVKVSFDTVRAGKNGYKLIMKIQDCGHVDFSTIEEMTDEFVKGNKSQGTGLGLNIVFRVIKEMGGELVLEKNPTQFVATIPVKKVTEVDEPNGRTLE